MPTGTPPPDRPGPRPPESEPKPFQAVVDDPTGSLLGRPELPPQVTPDTPEGGSGPAPAPPGDEPQRAPLDSQPRVADPPPAGRTARILDVPSEPPPAKTRYVHPEGLDARRAFDITSPQQLRLMYEEQLRRHTGVDLAICPSCEGLVLRPSLDAHIGHHQRVDTLLERCQAELDAITTQRNRPIHGRTPPVTTEEGLFAGAEVTDLTRRCLILELKHLLDTARQEGWVTRELTHQLKRRGEALDSGLKPPLTGHILGDTICAILLLHGWSFDNDTFRHPDVTGTHGLLGAAEIELDRQAGRVDFGRV